MFKLGERHVFANFNRLACKKPKNYFRSSRITGDLVEQHHLGPFMLLYTGLPCGQSQATLSSYMTNVTRSNHQEWQYRKISVNRSKIKKIKPYLEFLSNTPGSACLNNCFKLFVFKPPYYTSHHKQVSCLTGSKNGSGTPACICGCWSFPFKEHILDEQTQKVNFGRMTCNKAIVLPSLHSWEDIIQ